MFEHEERLRERRRVDPLDPADPFSGVPEALWLAWHAAPPEDLDPPETLSGVDRLEAALTAGPGPRAASVLGGLDPRGLLAREKVRGAERAGRRRRGSYDDGGPTNALTRPSARATPEPDEPPS